MVGIRSVVPEDAFTAATLGTERAGHGVLIGKGLVLTIGYLITEAERIWLTLSDGRVVEGHALAYDYESGFGLVQMLAKVELPFLPVGQSARTRVGDAVVLAGAGGRACSVASRVVARQEFAGYWEYVLDDAIFTEPAHPNWGGTAMIGSKGELLGIGSLQLEQSRGRGHVNMVVPIDLLVPILDDLMRLGRANRPARPWLGVFCTEVEDQVVVVGVAERGPAHRADLRTGDIILAVDDSEVSDLAGFYRTMWSLGKAGVEVPLTIFRDGDTFDVAINSTDRAKLLKVPRIH
ncbi:MAG: serine protease [Pseudorhodoplanes sp.]|nr:MAG: serine protease [Pseudorhodoplanes sp.]